MKFAQNVDLGVFYNSTKNDVAGYFRSPAIRENIQTVLVEYFNNGMTEMHGLHNLYQIAKFNVYLFTRSAAKL